VLQRTLRWMRIMQTPACHAWLAAVVLLTERYHSLSEPYSSALSYHITEGLLAGFVAVDGSTLSPHFEGFFWHCCVTRLLISYG